MNDDELLGALGDALEPPDRPVPADGLAAVRAQAAAAAADAPDAPGAPGASRRTLLVGSIAAAVGAAVGVAGTIVAASGDDADQAQPAGPPTRPVEFTRVPDGTTVDGRTIDHTWGMELLLDVSGLPVDQDYVVTYATDAGPVPAGGFRSVAVPMACRFTSTALRSAVSGIAITNQATGDLVLRGRLA